MKIETPRSGLWRFTATCVATIISVASAHAAEVTVQQDCRSIEDDALRLACHDSQYVPPQPAEVPQPVEPAASPVKEVPAAEPASLDDEIGKESLGRSNKDEVVVQGTVVRCAKDATKKYLFYFDNGQVWKQKDNTNIRWKECAFDVTITKDFFGYRMTPAGETRRVRISRVK